jgi:ABC-type polar amino acid transport system ATPase subunit
MLKISKLSKTYYDHKVLNNISLSFDAGEIVAIIGPSGSGKSTLLRCIIGLEKNDTGAINVDKHNRMGMVFQQFNLFHHMDLLKNLVYPQTIALKRSPAESLKKAKLLLKKMNLVGLDHKMPAQLSGGQKQRGAIARMLCMEPSILLFDEPTSALDPENVREVLNAIKAVAIDKMTTIIATHELAFAKDIATRIIFLEQGEVVEDSPKEQFFFKPKTKRAKEFIDKIL